MEVLEVDAEDGSIFPPASPGPGGVGRRVDPGHLAAVADDQTRDEDGDGPGPMEEFGGGVREEQDSQGQDVFVASFEESAQGLGPELAAGGAGEDADGEVGEQGADEVLRVGLAQRHSRG